MGKNKPERLRPDFLGPQTAMKSEFNAARSPLENGFTVIEASAGTGKTTTIAAVVLRFLVEKGIPIERILVTTYTELATAELRGRIRETITDALGRKCLPFVDEIITKIRDKKELERRLKIALQSFDDASIFTIHGFCARILADRAFESGVPFKAELVTDQSRFLNEVADDFWRTHFYTDDTMMSALLRERLKPVQLVELLTQLINNPSLRVTPPPEDRGPLQKKIAELCEAGADAEELTGLARRFIVSLQSEFCEWAREQLPRRKADRVVQSFDDLLTRLDEALRKEEGGELGKSLRERFAVALVDEFQDTDPVQYSIFSQIYGGSDSSVFFIGDPKQAIYGFRGADVFTYLKAAKVATRRYTLHQNWRSEAKLVDGVSAIFNQRDDAFVIEGIDFPPVAASGKTDAEALTTHGRRDQPLRFWIASTDNRSRVGHAVAADVASLLGGETKIGARRIEPRDIAVLVNTNTQPPDIQKALADYQIPSVVYSAASVLKSAEAEELLRILLAVAQPTYEKTVRAALATEVFGLPASALEMLSSDEADWEEILNRFADYHILWSDQGFVQMMRALLIGEKVRSRLLAWRDGDRRLTNLLHLIELLHTACVENRFGVDGLIKWLERQISGAGEGREDYELRLESDEDAVRIVTVHKSKGLEYEVTFCPFLRKEPWRRGKEFLKYHVDDELVLDLEESHREVQKREELAEMVRQLYVGLTRARHRSYLVWQTTRKKSKSALSWLFSEKVSADAFLEEKGESDTSAKVRAAFVGSDAVLVEDLPDRTGEILARPSAIDRPLAPRSFGREIDRSWRIASFSSLIDSRLGESEAPDYDAVESGIQVVEEPVLPAQGIHAFPGGMRAGTCLHLILEELDFTDLSQLRPLVTRKLADFHFENFDDVVCEMLEKTLSTPLGEDGFELSEISRTSRLSELEFTFPITALTTARLRKAFQLDELPLMIDRLQFAPANGFMKGFIDLVFERSGRFYFVDWKSNWLGTDASSYVPQNVAAEMMQNFYNLQLSIYAVALHRYLKQRLANYDYEKNFGGAFYVFLRGIDPKNPRNGIFFARPSYKFVRQLNQIFHGHAQSRN
jgi:exodeoxyribonuclease V beta subunit